MIYPCTISSKSFIEPRHGDNLSSLKLRYVESQEVIQQARSIAVPFPRKRTNIEDGSIPSKPQRNDILL